MHSYYECVFSFVEGSGWTSDWFWVSIGVLQGCTVSPTLFDLAFQLILNIHTAQARHLAFTFKKANMLVLKPTYADDVALYTNTASENQASITIFQDALNWSGCLVLRVSKCRSFAAMAFTKRVTQFKAHLKRKYSPYDPLLSVGGEFIMFIGNDVGKRCMFKYLGHWAQDDFGTDRVAELLDKRITGWIAIIYASLLTGPMESSILN